MNRKNNEWPELNFAETNETYQTIHLWTQIAGKIKVAQLPWINHSWHVTLLVTPFGLSTGDISATDKHFQINFDFVRHQLQITTSTGESKSVKFDGLSVAGCYAFVLGALKEFGIEIKINPVPNELADAVPFYSDNSHCTYKPEHAGALHKALLKSNEVLTKFRASFIGKCSPVHFFWGSFDLAVSRFSGRTAPLHPGGIPNLPDQVAQEAYSHEVSSCGFWPGNDMLPFAAFYSYIYPEPEGYKEAKVKPEAAYYHPELREFILPYAEVQKAENPEKTLLDFLQTTYDAGAGLANWDRKSLEKAAK